MKRKEIKDQFKIIKETLKNTEIELISFIYPPGGNFYVFSYPVEGARKHTFIDSGDFRCRDSISDVLKDNDINIPDIERIIITHRHLDHSGLIDFLSERSGAEIVTHPGFREFIEGRIRDEERLWLRGFDPTTLKDSRIRFLSMGSENNSIRIDGMEFPYLGDAKLGKEGNLQLIGCPNSSNMHTPDQLLALYSPSRQLMNESVADNDAIPIDDIIFSGDLWLMRGPVYDYSFFQKLPYSIRFMRYRLKRWMSGKSAPRFNVREQDEEAKEALKAGFSTIRVKPGHGEEFLGSRLIPQSLLATRDLLMKLGFAIHENETIFKRPDIAAQVTDQRQTAYTKFIDELIIWKNWGYTLNDISNLLFRIYTEQSGGRGSVKKDREERRKALKATLKKLTSDKSVAEELRSLAERASEMIASSEDQIKI